MKTQVTVEAGYSVYEIELRRPSSIVVDEVEISLRGPNPTEVGWGFEPHVVFLTGRIQRTVNDPVAAALRELASGKLPLGSKEWSTFEKTYSPGSNLGKMVPPRSILPESVRECFDSPSTRISGAIEKLVKLIRWRSSSSRLHQPLGSVLMLHRWFLDEGSWHPLPVDTGMRLFDSSLTVFDESLRSDVQELADKTQEPIAHALWREAWDILDKGPRSALTVGIAAAEVGFKELVAELAPDAKWLVENVPTPPLAKMLTDFLPLLPARNTFAGKTLAPPKGTLELLRNAIYERNKTTHTGQPAARERVEEILLMVRDLLWLFDYYGGQTWALGYIRNPPVSA